MSEMNLRVHDADPERVERIRLLCVSVLEARRRAAEARGPAPRDWLEPAIAVGVGAIYIVDAFANALAFFR